MKYEDLKILAELREKGALTEEEYQRKSKNIERREKIRYFRQFRETLIWTG